MTSWRSRRSSLRHQTFINVRSNDPRAVTAGFNLVSAVLETFNSEMGRNAAGNTLTLLPLYSHLYAGGDDKKRRILSNKLPETSSHQRGWLSVASVAWCPCQTRDSIGNSQPPLSCSMPLSAPWCANGAMTHIARRKGACETRILQPNRSRGKNNYWSEPGAWFLFRALGELWWGGLAPE